MLTGVVPGITASNAASELAALIDKISDGVVVARYAYKKMALAKRIEKIKEINLLHTQILNHIKVNDQSEMELHLPEIFIIGSESDENSIQGLHFTDAILNDINNSIAANGKGELLSYDICIEAAVSKIHAFYNRRIHDRVFWKRGKPTDDTSVVLCYLIEMLNTHCSKFEGCDIDIAILNALGEFVNQFKSLHGKNADRMHELTPVYNYLMQAKALLVKHSKVLSLDDLVEELIRSTKLYSFRMIKNFAKLITPSKNWKYVNTITIEEIIRKIVKPKSRKYAGKFFSKEYWIEENAITFDDSIFTNWLVRCGKDFLLATESDSLQDETEFNIENHKFKYNFTHREINRVRAVVFETCENFLTIKSNKKDQKSNTDKIEHIHKEAELLERMGLVADYANLIELILVTLYFAKHFQKSIKQLGQIYLENPRHFKAVFLVLENLGLLIRKNAEQLQDKISQLQNQHTNLELLAFQQNLLPEIIDTLRFAQGKIASSIEKIVVKHSQKNDSYHAAKLNQTDRHHLFLLAKMISDEYGIQIPRESEKSLNSPPPNSKLKKSKKEVQLPSTNPFDTDVEEKQAQEDAKNLKEFKEYSLSIKYPRIHLERNFENGMRDNFNFEDKYENIPETLASLIEELDCQIRAITEKSNKKEIYENLYLSLVKIQAKNLFLIAEKRTQKANDLYSLGIRLCKQVIEFLSHSEFYQEGRSQDFLKCIKDTIAEAIFVNKHREGHELLDFLHVPTNTKKIADEVEHASEELVKTVRISK